MSRTLEKMAETSPSSQSRSLTETVNGSHKFVIQGYSLAKGMGVGKHIASDNFTVGGYQWAIYFYPDGKNPEDNSAYVSVFIALASEGTDVRALFELTLVDQSGKGKHKVHSHFDRALESGPYTLKYRGSMWGYKRFFRRNLLESSDYLKDDCLKINCTVGVVVSATDCPRLHSIRVPESDIGAHFGVLLENMEASDITFDVAGQKFRAHKLVLAARSPLFRSEFFDGLEEDKQEIAVTNLEPKVFKAMLHFIYRDSLTEEVESVSSSTSCTSPVSDTLTAKLLAAADRYGLERLRMMCESHLCKDISVNSVAEILALADRYHATELKDVCLRFASENLAAVMRSDGFQYLKENCPALQSELLKTIAGCEEDCSSGGAKSRSVWAQLSDGGDTNGKNHIERYRESKQRGDNNNMEWCSHCLKTIMTDSIGDFTACSTCGKILGHVSVQRISRARAKRINKRAKENKHGTMGIDSSSSSSSSSSISGIHESNGIFNQATEDNQIIHGWSDNFSFKEMWCSHCLKTIRTESIGDFTACSTCGKVLGHVSVSRISRLSAKRISKRAKKNKHAIIGLDSSSCSSISETSESKKKWCTHCLKACRTECRGDLICCSWCGKVLGEVTVGSSSKLRRKHRYERIKRTKKNKHGTSLEVVEDLSASDKEKEYQ
ncbi:hypothetical protein SO802_019470 [Lithocarpus litseifolius]|uniref:BTB/POZ and MATH domain-containing protein 4 n=1 Tax=Lithocarpus litseifolius TaxID=425828 RepID=A0AAW2CNU4_9ROSI